MKIWPKIGDEMPDPSGRNRPCTVVYVEHLHPVMAVVARTDIVLHDPVQLRPRYVTNYVNTDTGEWLTTPAGNWSEGDNVMSQIASVRETIRVRRAGLVDDPSWGRKIVPCTEAEYLASKAAREREPK